MDLFQSILDSCDATLQVHAGGEYTFKLTDLASEVDLKWGTFVRKSMGQPFFHSRSAS